MLAPSLELAFIDAIFESISGLTTTGATVLSGLDYLDHSILFYRQLLQWLGGMGIVVLAVAILPALGVGGMQLYKTETPGTSSNKDNKLTPKITETAQALWYIYLGITIICALCYWIAGMSVFDAICHSFSTIAIGGFSTHDLSMGYFQSSTINIIASIFMFIAAVNFSLHFFAWKNTKIKHYFTDPELSFFIIILASISLISVIILTSNQTYPISQSLEYGIFTSISIATTTGFAVDNINAWPNALPFILFFASFAGGCMGSTAGGMKVMRILLLLKQGSKELKALVHPSAIFSIRLRGNIVSKRLMESLSAFIAIYLLTFVLLMIILLVMNVDMLTAWSTVTACLNNLGPGLGEASLNYFEFTDSVKAVLCAAMLLGRLEIMTVFVLFSRLFWQR
jgi:trk system potassium uptake protein TrkH